MKSTTISRTIGNRVSIQTPGVRRCACWPDQSCTTVASRCRGKAVACESGDLARTVGVPSIARDGPPQTMKRDRRIVARPRREQTDRVQLTLRVGFTLRFGPGQRPVVVVVYRSSTSRAMVRGSRRRRRRRLPRRSSVARRCVAAVTCESWCSSPC